MMQRMWINQPSTLQPDHALHGERVLVALSEWARGDAAIRVWFTHGGIISGMVRRLSLVPGWPTTKEG